MTLLLASRLWVLNHPIPVHGDEAGFIGGVGFPAPYPVHHPGYPLWVGLGTLLCKFGATPYGAFRFLSIVGSLAAPWLLYRGLRRLVPDGLAWWTALAFGVNPLVWFTSVTALTYTCAAAVGLLIVGLCWRANEPRASAGGPLAGARGSLGSGASEGGSLVDSSRGVGSLMRASFAMAVCVWLRLDFLAWLGPLFLFTMWRLRRRRPWACVLPLLISVAIYVPVVLWLYGREVQGRDTYDQFSYWLEVLFGGSVFRLGFYDGFIRNCAKFFGILAWLFGAATLLFVPAFLCLRRIRSRFPGAIAFLLIWTLPLTAFVLLIHMSEPGHIILLVPAGYCLVCFWLEVCTWPATALRIASAIALASAVQFLGYSWSAQVSGWRRALNAKVAYLSASGLRQVDHRWDIHTPSDIWPTAVHRPTASRPMLP
jgi:hypothetical protein